MAVYKPPDPIAMRDRAYMSEPIQKQIAEVLVEIEKEVAVGNMRAFVPTLLEGTSHFFRERGFTIKLHAGRGISDVFEIYWGGQEEACSDDEFTRRIRNLTFPPHG